jgi:DNA segregation ATPase FtsK/SpoIIIE-like protein
MLGRKGAEKLMGKGDLLFVGPNTDFPIRLQGGYISTANCTGIANYVSHNRKRLFSGEWYYKGVDGTTY